MPLSISYWIWQSDCLFRRLVVRGCLVSTCQALWAFISHHFLFVRADHAGQMVTGYNTDSIWRPNGLFSNQHFCCCCFCDNIWLERAGWFTTGNKPGCFNHKMFWFCFKCKFNLNLKIVSCAVFCVKLKCFTPWFHPVKIKLQS